MGRALARLLSSRPSPPLPQEPLGTPTPTLHHPSLKGGGKHINTAGGGALGSRPLFGDRNASCALMPGFEEADKFKPSTSRTPALHLQFYSSVSVWRGTEGGEVDAHRKRPSRGGLPNAGQ